jgi:periplasmic protein CpxP/Spy
MKRTLIIAALGCVAIGLLAGFGFGRARGPMDPKKMEKFITWRINDVLDDINATPTQRAAVLAVKDRLLPEAGRLMMERKGTHEVFAQAWKSDKPDAKALHLLVDQRADEMRALAHKVLDGALEIHDALTPTQREQLAAQAEEMHQMHHP